MYIFYHVGTKKFECHTTLLFSHLVMSDSLWSAVLHCLLKLAQTHVHWVGAAVLPSHPLSPPSPPAFSLSSIRVFSNELTLGIRWPKCWNFSISPSNKYSGVVSLGINWLDLLAVQGTLSRVFSSTTLQMHQFYGIQPSSWSNSQIHTWLLEKW